MHPFARVAAVILAVGLTVSGALYLFGGGALVGGPSPTPTPLPTPTSTPFVTPMPTPSADILDTTTWTSFTSERYGYRAGVPSGWHTRPATKTWVVPEGPDTTTDEWDEAMDPFEGFRFWSSSVPLPAGETFEAWASDYRRRQVDPTAPAGCDQTKQSLVPVTVDGTAAVLRVGCGDVETILLSGGRVYSFGGIETFGNDPGVSESFRALYDTWLTTVTLDPSAARDVPDASPSPS